MKSEAITVMLKLAVGNCVTTQNGESLLRLQERLAIGSLMYHDVRYGETEFTIEQLVSLYGPLAILNPSPSVGEQFKVLSALADQGRTWGWGTT